MLYICSDVCIYTSEYSYVYIWVMKINSYEYACIPMHIDICICIYEYWFMFVNTRIGIYIFIYICIYWSISNTKDISSTILTLLDVHSYAYICQYTCRWWFLGWSPSISLISLALCFEHKIKIMRIRIRLGKLRIIPGYLAVDAANKIIQRWQPRGWCGIISNLSYVSCCPNASTVWQPVNQKIRWLIDGNTVCVPQTASANCSLTDLHAYR
jgi:hypothetical protein